MPARLMEVMKTAAFLTAATTTAALHVTLLPRAEPTITRDPWQCATENITQYLDVPKPTGSMLTALLSYADKLYADCTITGVPTGTVIPTCPFPEQSRWCSFTSVAPKSVLSDYSSYGSAASSWWAAHSSGAVSAAQYCPNSWYELLRTTPNGETWLNDTIVFAGCYAEAHQTSALPTSTPASGSGSAAIPTKTTAKGSQTTPTTSPNSVAGRMDRIDMWKVAGTGLAAAAMNSVM